MKKSLLFTLLVAAGAVCAQGMTQGEMMQNMQKAQACMAQIDRSAMQRFGDEAQAMQSKIKSLCVQGKRDEAQEQAMAFGMKVSSQPELVKMRECMELMRGMMPVQPYFGPEQGSDQHVCDI